MFYTLLIRSVTLSLCMTLPNPVIRDETWLYKARYEKVNFDLHPGIDFGSAKFMTKILRACKQGFRKKSNFSRGPINHSACQSCHFEGNMFAMKRNIFALGIFFE